MPSQAPITVRGEVNHLVNDPIANPGTLLARWTINKRIVRVELHGANTRRKDAVQCLIITAKTCAFLPRVELFLDRKTLERNRTLHPVDQHVDITKAVGIKHLKVVVVSSSDVPCASTHIDVAAWVKERLF